MAQAITGPENVDQTQLNIFLLGGAALTLVGGLVYGAAPPHLSYCLPARTNASPELVWTICTRGVTIGR